jgi:hypothetical protein
MQGGCADGKLSLGAREGNRNIPRMDRSDGFLHRLPMGRAATSLRAPDESENPRFMKPLLLIAAVILAAFALIAHNSREAQRQKDAGPGRAPGPTPALRDETKKLEGAAAVGIDGKQLRRSVDKVLDANDERNRQLQEAIKQIDER